MHRIVRISLHLASRLTSGLPVLDHHKGSKQRCALLVSEEDGRRQMKHRLKLLIPSEEQDLWGDRFQLLIESGRPYSFPVVRDQATTSTATNEARIPAAASKRVTGTPGDGLRPTGGNVPDVVPPSRQKKSPHVALCAIFGKDIATGLCSLKSERAPGGRAGRRVCAPYAARR